MENYSWARMNSDEVINPENPLRTFFDIPDDLEAFIVAQASINNSEAIVFPFRPRHP